MLFHFVSKQTFCYTSTGLNVMLKIVQGLEDAIFANLSKAYVYRDLKSSKIVVQLLKCYSNKLLPGIHEAKDYEVVILLCFAVNIWNHTVAYIGIGVTKKELIDCLGIITRDGAS